MRFWESSATVPLLLDEARTGSLKSMLREDPEMVVWWGTGLECQSAIRRRERAGDIDTASVHLSLDILETLAHRWIEVLPGSEIRSHAARLLATHALRAADSLQLAAAIAWRRYPETKPDFVCLDGRLADAASREGFTCVPAID